jgi:hypothetical protein
MVVVMSIPGRLVSELVVAVESAIPIVANFHVGDGGEGRVMARP